MSKIITYNRPSFLVPHQLQILDDSQDLICVEGGTKSGKTAALAILAIEESLKGSKGDEVYWVAPISSQAEVGFNYVLEFIEGTSLQGKEAIYGQKKEIYLCNGVTIKFIGNGEDKKSTNRIYNNRAIFVIVDEASRCCPDIFSAVQSITTQTQGRIVMVGNVLTKQNWFYQLCRKIENKEIQGGYYKITYRDAIKARILSEKKIQQIKNTIDPWDFASLYECEPLDDFKNPFGLNHIDNCIVDYDINTIENVEYFGIDVGRYHDKTAIIGINREGEIGVIDVFLNDHTLQRERIRNIVGVHSRAYMDTTAISAGDVYFDELKEDMPELCPYNFTNASKKELIGNLALYIQKGRLKIPKDQDMLIKELKNYELKITDAGVIKFSNNNISKFDDIVIALGLACMAHKDLVEVEFECSVSTGPTININMSPY